MTSYEELRSRVAKAISGSGVTFPRSIRQADAALAEVFHTLETVTPEMVKAWDNTLDKNDFPTSEDYASSDWLAMLHASPLTPPPKG